MFHPLTIHGSQPNTAGRTRRALVVNVIGDGVLFYPADGARHGAIGASRHSHGCSSSGGQKAGSALAVARRARAKDFGGVGRDRSTTAPSGSPRSSSS